MMSRITKTINFFYFLRSTLFAGDLVIFSLVHLFIFYSLYDIFEGSIRLVILLSFTLANKV